MRAPIEEIPLEMQVDGIETRGVEWGEQLLRHIDLPAGVDFTPLFKGLPGDMCQCPHWGIVLKGSINLRYADGSEEVTRAGEAYYWPGGHTGWTDEGVTFLEVSPADELQPGARAPRRADVGADLTGPRPSPLGGTVTVVGTDGGAELEPPMAASDALTSARDALARHDWQVCLRPRARTCGSTTRPQRRSASTCSPRRPGGSAAWTSASTPGQRAYRAFDELGDRRRAGQCAVWLYEHHCQRARPAIASGWLRRARRALEADADCIEHGALLLREAELAHGDGRLDEAADLAERARALGRDLAVPGPRGRGTSDGRTGAHRRGSTGARPRRTSTRPCCSPSRAA